MSTALLNVFKIPSWVGKQTQDWMKSLTMKLQKTKIAAYVAIFILLASDFCLAEENKVAQPKPLPAEVLNWGPNDMLCAERSLYIALHFLDAKTDWSELNAAFPGAAENGTSLAQMFDYLTNKGFHCKYAEMGKDEIQEMDNSILAFVLTQNKKMAHIHLMRKPDSATIQVIDAPKPPVVSKISDFGTDSFVCLLVAKDKEKLPSNNDILRHIISLCMTGAGIILLVLAFRGKKK